MFCEFRCSSIFDVKDRLEPFPPEIDPQGGVFHEIETDELLATHL
jgi:hypothetical protein